MRAILLGFVSIFSLVTMMTFVKVPPINSRSPIQESPSNPFKETVSPEIRAEITAQSQSSVLSVSTSKQAPKLIGIYESSSPSSPESLSRLDEIADAGFNTVLNYSIFDGSKSQIKAYLDHAQDRAVKVIFSLKDFYDIEPSPWINLSDLSQYGSSNDQIVRSIVSEFKGHPAIWGWYISDERPEIEADLGKWLPALSDRYHLIKTIDPVHPTLSVLACYQGDTGWLGRNMDELTKVSDSLGFDTYPVPYSSLNVVGSCARTFSRTDGGNWAVLQAFSWASYPEIAESGGMSLGIARYPTLNELSEMVRHTDQGGSKNLLFYSYFDLKNDRDHFSTEWQKLVQVIKKIKN